MKKFKKNRKGKLFSAIKKSLKQACRSKGIEINSQETNRIIDNALSKASLKKIDDADPLIPKIIENTIENIENLYEKNLDSLELMPNDTKFKYAKRNKKTFVIEQKPTTRNLSFTPDVDEIDCRYGDTIRLSIPYAVFILTFIKSNTSWYWDSELILGFRNEPIKSIDCDLYYPYLPNMRGLHNGCFPFAPTEQSISNMVNDIIMSWWSMSFRYWEAVHRPYASKGHFTLRSWAKETAKDPLYGIKVNWEKTTTIRKVMEEKNNDNSRLLIKQITQETAKIKNDNVEQTYKNLQEM
jgi:hypothetical protein